MKKLLFLFVAVSTLVLTSCSKEDEPKEKEEKTIIKVKVTKNGESVAGETVCIFDSESSPNSTFFSEFHAKKKVITESNGVATFDLLETFDLEVINSQSTFYFGIFKDKQILGSSATTIKKGETKNIEIKL